MDMAMTMGAPVICMNDSGGARIQEGICALAGYGVLVFRKVSAPSLVMVRSSSATSSLLVSSHRFLLSWALAPVVPFTLQPLTDFIIMKEQTSYMFLTGPKVVKTVTGEDIDAETSSS